MLTLQNNDLSVQILDPNKDRDKFGTRYCTGGYIFQIEDKEKGPLLSGPLYPEGFTPFHGQGIPDAFNRQPLYGTGCNASQALIVGIGVCDMDMDEIMHYTDWKIQADEDRVTMTTEQALCEHKLILTKTIILQERSVSSRIHVTNKGEGQLPLRWFPHPFFPQPESDQLVKIPGNPRIVDEEGYVKDETGFICRNAMPQGEGGYFTALEHRLPAGCTILQKHPLTGLVAAEVDYAPGFFPVWGNERTISWEPYFERTLHGEQSEDWGITYHF